MRAKVACSDDDRANFWKEIDGLPAAEPPPEIATALKASLPSDATLERFASRAKGGGSLGRPRFVAIAEWRGGRIVREAKALVTSGWNFAHGDLAAPIQFLTDCERDVPLAGPVLEDRVWIYFAACDGGLAQGRTG